MGINHPAEETTEKVIRITQSDYVAAGTLGDVYELISALLVDSVTPLYHSLKLSCQNLPLAIIKIQEQVQEVINYFFPSDST